MNIVKVVEIVNYAHISARLNYDHTLVRLKG